MADSLTTAVRRRANPNAKPRQLRLCFALALFWGLCGAAWPVLAATLVDWTHYTIPFGSPPSDGAGAIASFPARAMSMINYFACGQENEFLSLALDPSAGNDGTGATFINDGVLYRAMAKLALLKTGASECGGTFNVVIRRGNTQGSVGDFFNNSHFLILPDFAAFMSDTFGRACEFDLDPKDGKTDVNRIEVDAPASNSANPFATVTSQITAACLKAEIEFVLSQVSQGDFQPGSSDIPCHLNPFDTTKGDWDMRMRTLVRILLLDKAQSGDTGAEPILSTATSAHIQNDLLSLETSVGTDTYSIFGCGDTERDTDNSQDREASASSEGDFLDSVSDASGWFLKFLIELYFFLTPEGAITAVASVLPSPLSAAVAVLNALGITEVLLAQVPETENHRLAIESTRFLKNQVVIQDLHSTAHFVTAPGVIAAQQGVKSWLLDRFQQIAKNEFIEYNARPYHDISLSALRNLADFATDADVRNGAQMLIEFSAAKFAVGSNSGRRLAPFRRHFYVVNCIDGQSCADDASNNTPIEIFRSFDTGSGDGEVALGLLFNGQTQQLPFGSIPVEAVGEALNAATTHFLPNSLITDLAIRKDAPSYQRIHHDGYEIYSNSPGALISAGGIETDHAYHLLVAGIPVSGPWDQTQDIGAGVPTTVMFPSDPIGSTDNGATTPGASTSKMTLDAFITFRGNRKTEGGTENFADNLCVWQNFACGVNLRIPDDIVNCLAPSTTSLFFFFDSAACPGYRPTSVVPHFYFALFLICGNASPCFTSSSDPSDEKFPNNAGFLEIVDNPPVSFDQFKAMVESNNSNIGKVIPCVSDLPGCSLRYRTFSSSGPGHLLVVDPRAHQNDSDKSGILSVDGVDEKDLDEVNLAEGDSSVANPAPITSQGDGVIAITNVRLGGKEIILNFSHGNHPCRQTGPGALCTQQ